jgi:integrase
MNASNALKRFMKPGRREATAGPGELESTPHQLRDQEVAAGADPKSVQGQMRHSRISTTLDSYAQLVPDGQKKAAARLTECVAEQVEKSGPIAGPLLVQQNGDFRAQTDVRDT